LHHPLWRPRSCRQ